MTLLWAAVRPHQTAGTCLDLTGDAVLQLQELPELMLLPSDLAPFAKLVPAAAPTAAGGCYMPTQGRQGRML